MEAEYCDGEKEMVKNLRKNGIFTIALVLTLLVVFSGCPDPVKESGNFWVKGLDDLVVDQGESFGELTYSFSTTIPAADTYTMYYAV